MTEQPQFPDWAEELRSRYMSGEASLFLLHGNVRDLQPWKNPNGTQSKQRCLSSVPQKVGSHGMSCTLSMLSPQAASA